MPYVHDRIVHDADEQVRDGFYRANLAAMMGTALTRIAA